MSKKNKNKKMKYETPTEVLFSDSIYPEFTVQGGVVYTRFQPIGFGHELQHLMTDLLHELVMKYSDMTLAEMGFLHTISILYEEGRVKMRIYFNPDLATYREEQANGQSVMKPIPQFGIMNGYFFVLPGKDIDLTQVIGFDKILVQKSKIEYDELGKPALKLKKDASDMKMQEVLYVECNLPVTIAACMDLNLFDPNFKVSIETVGQTNNPKKRIIVDGKENSYQIWVNVQHSADESGYDPDTALPYLIGLADRRNEKDDAQKELADRAAEDAKKKKKKEKESKQKVRNFI